MATTKGKTLTVNVEVKTKNAEKQIANLIKTINNVNKELSKTTRVSSGITKALSNANKTATKLSQNVSKVNNTNNKAANSAKNMAKNYNSAALQVHNLHNLLRSIAGMWIFTQGLQIAIKTSDDITKAENKLNYSSAKNLGAAGYNADGSYSVDTFKATSEAMDKMYVSANKVRMSYTEMMNNVGKSMTLAGEAFDNNIDVAIRFQEIMAEAYAVGGASEAEKSSSMYQMMQALGSGILQGDELRSVREGASLAYQKIEKFAQALYNTDESLKDLASDGYITSDIVVSAIVSAGDELDKAFKNTKMTFEQVMVMMKNTTTKACESVLKQMNDMLNQIFNTDAGKAFIESLQNGVLILADALGILLNGLSKVVTFIVENWDWMKYIFLALVSIILTSFTVMAAQAIKTAVVWFFSFSSALAPLYGFIFLVGVILAGLSAITGGFKTTTDFIIACLFAILMAAIIVMTIIMVYSWIVTGTITLGATLIVLLIIAAIALLLIVFLTFTQEICAFIWAAGATIWNIVSGLVNGLIQLVWTGFVEPFGGIVEWVLNASNDGFNSFGGAVANLIGQIISWFLSLGKVVTKIIDAIFGTDWTSGLESLQDKVLAWGKNEKAITLSREAPTVMERKDVSDAWDKGWNVGTNIQNKINNLGGSLKTKMNAFSNLPNTSGALDMAGYDPNGVANDIDDINKNTKKTAELTEEDLKYLRQVAEMEWKKEFTTASITVQMTNQNNINGESDLDGIVTKLSDKLKEELNVVASGVYA